MIAYVEIFYDQLDQVNDILDGLSVTSENIISINDFGTYTRIWYVVA